MDSIFGDLLAFVGGFFVDAFLMILGLNDKWGFAYEKNPVLCLFAGLSLFMIPIGLLNSFEISTFLMLLGSVFFFSFIIYISYGESKKTRKIKNHEEIDILDDDFKS